MSFPRLPGLSLRDPWSFCVTRLNKRVENRKWGTKFRGVFAVHLSRGCDEDDISIARAFLTARDLLKGFDGYHDTFRRRGGVVGLSAVLDVVEPYQKDGAKRFELLGIDPRWWMKAQYGFALAPVKPLEPFPVRGMPNFFPLSDNEAVRQELETRLLALWEAPPLVGEHCASCGHFTMRPTICSIMTCGATLCPDCEPRHQGCP